MFLLQGSKQLGRRVRFVSNHGVKDGDQPRRNGATSRNPAAQGPWIDWTFPYDSIGGHGRRERGKPMLPEEKGSSFTEEIAAAGIVGHEKSAALLVRVEKCGAFKSLVQATTKEQARANGHTSAELYPGSSAIAAPSRSSAHRKAGSSR